jgi:hypothetical protein
MNGADQGYIDMKDCLNSVVGTGTVEGHGFGCTPRKVVWTTNLGADTGYTLGISITETPNTALTAATADKISTNVGESTIEGLTPQQRYFNWCLLSDVATLGNGAAGDVIALQGLG